MLRVSNVINGSFTYGNMPPISVTSTPNFQTIRIGFAGVGLDLRSDGNLVASTSWSRPITKPAESDVVSYAIADAVAYTISTEAYLLPT